MPQIRDSNFGELQGSLWVAMMHGEVGFDGGVMRYFVNFLACPEGYREENGWGELLSDNTQGPVPLLLTFIIGSIRNFKKSIKL